MNLAGKLEQGEFIVLAEIEPPKGVDVSSFLSVAARIKDHLDAVVVPEMNNAVMKMSSLGGTILLQGKGVPTILQMACRDRNRLALQADLLAAAALGVENLMVVTGQDPSQGDQREASPVYDLTPEDLLMTVRNLGAGRDLAGVELAGAARFTVGALVDPLDTDRALQERAALTRNLELGAEFFITPPLFDPTALEPFVQETGVDKSRLIVTVLILKSYGMARFINLHQKNVTVSREYLDRFKKTKDRGREGVEVAVETVRTVREAGYGGVMISPLGWEDRLASILDKLG